MKPSNKLRTFYVLLLTQSLSLIGSRISALAIAIQIFRDTGQATPLTLVTFFGVLPTALIGSLSGALVDRWDRRSVLILSDTGQALGTLFLLFSFSSGNFQLWHLYLVTIFRAMFSLFQSPAFQSAATILVPEKHRDRANTVRQVNGPMVGILAPILAGAIYAAYGVEGAILIDIITYLAAITIVLNITIPRPKQSVESQSAGNSVWAQMIAGFRVLGQKRGLLHLILFIAVVNSLLSGATTLITPYILARTGSEELVGLLLGIPSASAVIGSLIFGFWGGFSRKVVTILVGIIAEGCFLALIGTGRGAVGIGIGLLGIYIALPMVNASFLSLLQAKIPADFQGRVYATVRQVSLILTPFTYFAIGPLADHVFEPAVGGRGWETVEQLVGQDTGAGMGLLMVAAGTVVMLTATMLLSLRHMRNMEAILPDYTVALEEDAATTLPQTESDAFPDVPQVEEESLVVGESSG